jgi:hypothetical protein
MAGLPKSQTLPMDSESFFRAEGPHPNIPITDPFRPMIEKHEVLISMLSRRALSGRTPKAWHSS